MLILGHSSPIASRGRGAHENHFIESKARKYTQVEKYHRYDPVEIELKSVAVLNYNVTYRRGVNNDTEFYTEKTNKTRIPILLLHGPDWQSETWEWLGTLNKLVEFGFDPIAVDVPGRGDSVGGAALSDDERSDENVEFWDAFVRVMQLDPPILLSASISHRFVMGWLNKHKSVSSFEL